MDEKRSLADSVDMVQEPYLGNRTMEEIMLGQKDVMFPSLGVNSPPQHPADRTEPGVREETQPYSTSMQYENQASHSSPYIPLESISNQQDKFNSLLTQIMNETSDIPGSTHQSQNPSAMVYQPSAQYGYANQHSSSNLLPEQSYTYTTVLAIDDEELFQRGRRKDKKKRCRNDGESEDDDNFRQHRKKPLLRDSMYDETESEKELSIYNPVLTPQGTFRDSVEIRPTSHFTEEDRETMMTLKKNQETILTKLDEMYRLMKYLVESKHSVDSTHGTGTTTSTPKLVVKEDSKESSEMPNLDEEKFILENGINLLRVYGKDPCKYVLSLMDVLFTKQEMAKCCFVVTKKSKKPQLPGEKLKLIEECVTRKYGKGVYTNISEELRKKANQKCLDQAKKLKNIQKINEVDETAGCEQN